jgi:hypothetical protein
MYNYKKYIKISSFFIKKEKKMWCFRSIFFKNKFVLKKKKKNV